MKLITCTVYLICGVALVMTGTASGDARVYSQSGNVTIEYLNPEDFRDVESSFSKRSNVLAELARSIDEELERRLRASFGEDAKLELTITDVDLAGRVNPAGRSDVRILKDVWPPRIDFSYKLLGADGSILAEGEKELVDLGYLSFAGSQSRHEVFRYEREMMKDWLRGLSRELSR